LLLLVLAVSAKRYDGSSVLRMELNRTNPKHDAAMKLLLDMDREQAQLWCSHDVQVFPDSHDHVVSLLENHEVPFKVMIDDVQRLIDEQKAHSELIKKKQAEGPGAHAGADPFFSDYHTFDEINTWIDQQAAAFPDLINVTTYGASYEGRVLRAVRITKNTGTVKPAIVWEGGIHAREWIAHATMLYMISKLTTDPTASSYLENFEFHLIPVVNPDGYVYTWTDDRNWRKTRSPNTNSPCIGTDPNRNWDDHWCEQGASTQPCSDSYCGSKAFSEVEVRSVANYVMGLTTKQPVLEFIDYHSYGQLYMAPYGWSPAPPPNATEQATLGQGSCKVIESVNGMVYEYGRIYEIIYPASGSSADWGYTEAGIVFSYGIELRDTGEYGFLLPADQIVPQGEEIWASLKYNADQLTALSVQ